MRNNRLEYMRICRFWDPCDRINRWRIGPLFADNSKIARSLYRSAFIKLAEVDPSGIMTADVPCGDLFDQGTTQIAKELTGTPVVTCVRMYTKGVPSSMQMKKTFVHTTLEIDSKMSVHSVTFCHLLSTLVPCILRGSHT